MRRCVAPRRIETGRHENMREDQRICPICKSDIENEMHAMLKCYLYGGIRTALVDTALSICNDLTPIK